MKMEDVIKNENEELNKENKRYKMLLLVSLAVLFIAIVIGFIVVDGETKEENKTKVPDNANNISDDTLSFNCNFADSEGNRLNNGISVFGKDDYLMCSIEMDYTYNESIASMSFDFDSKDIELLKLTTTSDILDVSLDNNHVLIKRLNNNDIIKRSDINKVDFYLHIKGNKSFEINLKNVNIRILNDVRVDYINNKKVTINNGESRYYKENDTFIFEKVQKDGTFKKANEYKCKVSMNCNANPASQTFHYQNDNQKVTMIADENHNTFVMFDVDKGVIGTYTDNAVWLRTNDMNNKYIYIQDKLTGMYGIIDVNGKVIHEFNLSNTTGIDINGMIASTYSVENDIIVETKNGKYGISRIKSNDTVIDYNFDAIRLFATKVQKEEYNFIKNVSGKYFEAKINNKWYLYSLETKNMVFNEGYDNIFVVNDEIFIVESNKSLYIKDVNGNNLVEAIPSLTSIYNETACCGENTGIEVIVKDDTITIKTYADIYSDTVYNHYEYNISSKSLINVK